MSAQEIGASHTQHNDAPVVMSPAYHAGTPEIRPLTTVISI